MPRIPQDGTTLGNVALHIVSKKIGAGRGSSGVTTRAGVWLGAWRAVVFARCRPVQADGGAVAGLRASATPPDLRKFWILSVLE